MSSLTRKPLLESEDQAQAELRKVSGRGIIPLWQMDIVELTGHNIESRGRQEVNRLLEAGWVLLHIYTLKYQEDGVWRERPMAILGRPRRLKALAAPEVGWELSEARGTAPQRGRTATSLKGDGQI